MITRIASLALLLSACTTQPVENESAPQTAPQAGCDLKVDFASIGTGIDSDVLQKVDALLANDTGIAAVDRQRWGLEGEVTLCADTKTDADAARLFDQVKALFPGTSSRPLRVETRAGQRYQAPAS